MDANDQLYLSNRIDISRYLFLSDLHRAPIPEEEPLPGEAPSPDEEEPAPHPDPVTQPVVCAHSYKAAQLPIAPFKLRRSGSG